MPFHSKDVDSVSSNSQLQMVGIHGAKCDDRFSRNMRNILFGGGGIHDVWSLFGEL